MTQTFLACTELEADLSWLQTALAPMGQVLRTSQSLDELFGLIDATGATLVFVGVDRENLSAQCALIESLLEARPLLAVMVLGDGFDNDLVIASMRAGARDFVTQGLRGSEVLGLVRRITERLPALPARKQQGNLTLLFGNQPDADAGLIAAHMALTMQKSGQRTLLVDLGVPVGESLDVLALEPSFVFSDAVRNLRRIDRSLIDSAFVEHDSGLRVLPSGGTDGQISLYSSSELFLLTAALRQNFDQVLVNLTGQPDSEVLRNFLGQANQLCWYVDPSVSCCRRNLDLLLKWRNDGVKLDHARLLIDRHFSNVAPDAKALGRTFEMPVLAALPASAELRLKARNQRINLFQLAPRDPLTRSLGELVAQLTPDANAPAPGLVQRLVGLVK
ncbi:pilus assembly protein [Pseudomonas sp. G11-1]|uniref:AAA family ATPase n=1 Tax=Halopseudomonas sp. SMJS2 TaxID=3041098 RepID=UPI0024534869|nr:pilus assembly protein [Halopseudomonas sp. SMJS2]MCO5786853.1 pilus assembly protein [Pseudomonas sp. G11-1]MCO5790079.1 pilus assembly protein [Pseudomonas sp. G11-2]WGK61778.1 pilus assembly protein [Halopseudomonas sp. SMJS2]